MTLEQVNVDVKRIKLIFIAALASIP
jgi:hypothetical protein